MSAAQLRGRGATKPAFADQKARPFPNRIIGGGLQLLPFFFNDADEEPVRLCRVHMLGMRVFDVTFCGVSAVPTF